MSIKNFCFKTVIGYYVEEKELRKILLSRGVKNIDVEHTFDRTFIFFDGIQLSTGNAIKFTNSHYKYMDIADLKHYLVTNFDRVDMETGEWITFDIDASGILTIGTRDYEWQMIEEILLNHGGVFGGWFYDKLNMWSCQRFGLTNSGTIVESANDWVEPIIPNKIRFWTKSNTKE